MYLYRSLGGPIGQSVDKETGVGHGECILVVDDDANVRLAIKKGLEVKGYEVEASSHIMSAVGASLTDDYVLVTLDLHLGEIDGPEAVELMRVCNVKTPILIISGNLTDAKVEALRAQGVQHFLPKPFTLEQLWAAAEQAINSSRKEDREEE